MDQPRSDRKPAQRLSRLKGRRRILAHQLSELDAAIFALQAHGSRKKELSGVEFERALDELTLDLPKRTSLPRDFSRADLYSDHD